MTQWNSQCIYIYIYICGVQRSLRHIHHPSSRQSCVMIICVPIYQRFFFLKYYFLCAGEPPSLSSSEFAADICHFVELCLKKDHSERPDSVSLVSFSIFVRELSSSWSIYRVAWSLRIPYLYRSFSAKKP